MFDASRRSPTNKLQVFRLRSQWNGKRLILSRVKTRALEGDGHSPTLAVGAFLICPLLAPPLLLLLEYSITATSFSGTASKGNAKKTAAKTKGESDGDSSTAVPSRRERLPRRDASAGVSTTAVPVTTELPSSSDEAGM